VGREERSAIFGSATAPNIGEHAHCKLSQTDQHSTQFTFPGGIAG